VKAVFHYLYISCIKLKIGDLTRLQHGAEHRREFRLLEFLYCIGKEA